MSKAPTKAMFFNLDELQMLQSLVEKEIDDLYHPSGDLKDETKSDYADDVWNVLFQLNTQILTNTGSYFNKAA